MNSAAKTLGLTFAKPLFPPGHLYATPGDVEALSDAGQQAAEFLNRHRHGDWGELSVEDKRENDYLIDKHLRIFSPYHTSKGVKLWVITEADRSLTTILLPCEY